ncbi:hypothetical protein ACQ4PT_034776 [Festuca glaucescens]
MAGARCYRDCPRSLADLSTRNESGNDGSHELDAVDICINNLHEKRRCKREAGLEGLIGLLEGFIPTDKVDYRYLTIFYRCRTSIDKGSAGEAVLAYRTIGLLALNVGASADCSMEILTNTLHLHALVKTLRTPSAAAAAKVVAAIDCLAAVTFAAARRPQDVGASLRALWSVIRISTGPGKLTNNVVLIAAMSAWTLLLTTLEGDFMTYSIPFRDLADLLDTSDPALLTASGEAVAVCAELRLTRHASPEDMQALESNVSSLVSGTGDESKKLNKHRFMFQEIAAIMKRAQCSDEELVPTSSIQGSVLRVSKWARMVQLSFLKRFLDKGFDKHIAHNPLFREHSSYIAANESNELPAVKSKQQRFGREKQWSVDLRKDRMISWENKNAFQLP